MTFNKEDMLIILGDAGINYCLNEEDNRFKEYLKNIKKKYSVKMFCIRGNHEERTENINAHKEINTFVEKYLLKKIILI